MHHDDDLNEINNTKDDEIDEITDISQEVEIKDESRQDVPEAQDIPSLQEEKSLPPKEKKQVKPRKNANEPRPLEGPREKNTRFDPFNPFDPVIITIKKIVPTDIPYPIKSLDLFGYYDIYADFASTQYGNALPIPSGRYRIVPTNLQFEVPKGYEINVKSIPEHLESGIEIRGHSFKDGLKIVLYNDNKQGTVIIPNGQRIAQIVVVPVLDSTLFIKE